MTNKKLVLISLLILTLGLTACGTKNKETQPTKVLEETQEETLVTKVKVNTNEKEEKENKKILEQVANETLQELEKNKEYKNIEITVQTSKLIDVKLNLPEDVETEGVAQKIFDKYSEIMDKTQKELTRKYTFNVNITQGESKREVSKSTFWEDQ